MQITVKAKNPKHNRRLKRWIPFIEKAFARLQDIIPDTAKLPEEITLKPLRSQRIPGTDYAFCNYWGRMGRTWDGKWWLGMDMKARTGKFRETLLHEIAHFGAVAINDNWKDDPEWAALFKRLRKEMRLQKRP